MSAASSFPEGGRPFVEFTLAFPTGGWFEVERGRPSGITHVIEHVLYAHVHEVLRQRGLLATLSAETTYEFMTLGGRCLTEDLDSVVDCIWSVVDRSALDATTFAAEVRVVAAELAATKRSVARAAYRRVLETVFAAGPIHGDWEGDPVTLARDLSYAATMEHWCEVRNSGPVLCTSSPRSDPRGARAPGLRLPGLKLRDGWSQSTGELGERTLFAAVVPGYGHDPRLGPAILDNLSLRRHSAQRRMNDEFGIREVHFALMPYFDFSLVTALVRLPRDERSAAAAATVGLLAAPFAEDTAAGLDRLGDWVAAGRRTNRAAATKENARHLCAGVREERGPCALRSDFRSFGVLATPVS